MFTKPGEISKAFWVWILANLLGFMALAAESFVLLAVMPRPGFVPTLLMISLPIGVMQWVGLRRSFSISRGWILTVPLGMYLAVLVFQHPPAWLGLLGDDESTAVLTALYLVLGLAIGLPQWLLLRRHFPNASIWLLGSSFGVAAGIWLVLATGLINRTEFVSYIVVILVYAVITGLTLARLLPRAEQHPAQVLDNPIALPVE
jgi:hypothetical protein